MKRILSLVLLAAFSMVIAGCEAGGHVGDADHDSHPDAGVHVDTK